MTAASDTLATAGRIERLRQYMGAQVLGSSGECVCRKLGSCRRSVLFDRHGAPRPEVSFAAGQLSHVGRHYDLTLDGVPCRILVIAMDTARLREHVKLEQRHAEVMQSAELPFTGRNAHMQGTTSALRLAVGHEPGDDREGEQLRLSEARQPVHLFDAYAMANLRLCSAMADGESSLSKATMSRNCLPHLAATIKILEPTLCIVQGVQVNKVITELISRRRQVAPHLTQARVAGVDTLVATFTNPSARGSYRWGPLNGGPYLYETVAAALRVAHQLVAGAPAPAGNANVHPQRRPAALDRQPPR
ncbi:hypothetical protein [Micromonospora cremea]|uniref:Uracil DNA glycosylase superfamily protein n=1 Tax=Micromonospora cremea TaxID=709881 RepID=A0A1N5VVD8_9ACTN|nr:hypothetical protein [Micromonospora cremea]SIM77052.1 hypothetical protein SAMN04489832_1916 [Micromonospora cremea]